MHYVWLAVAIATGIVGGLAGFDALRWAAERPSAGEGVRGCMLAVLGLVGLAIAFALTALLRR